MTVATIEELESKVLIQSDSSFLLKLPHEDKHYQQLKQRNSALSMHIRYKL